MADLMSRLVRPLPRRAVLALGRGVGRFWADLDPRHVRIAVANLRPAFPHWDEARLLRTARGVYSHFGAVLLDILWLFEPVAVVARPLDNPVLDARLVAFRRKSGNSVLYKRSALGQALRHLRSGRAVAFLVDQNVQAEEAVFVEFFGRPAASTTVAAALAVRASCPIVHGWTELKADGRYLMRYGVLRPRAGAERGAEVARLTQELAHIVEGYVRSAPEQWLWIHRRWKTRPPGEGC
jgi:KDO2-lipid IV(A) lauroyltransferase